MKKLISMTDFVFYIDNNREFGRNYDKILAYAKFIKQPLKIWMFVPCELVGNEFSNWQPLQEPNEKKYWELIEIKHGKEVFKKHTNLIEDEVRRYQKAKEKCLFVWQDGFDYKAIGEMFTDLEDLIPFEFELTPLAVKLLEAGI